MSAEIKTINGATAKRQAAQRADRRGHDFDRRVGLLLYPEANAIQAQRPRTRGDCIDGPRPCPWVACRHHLYLQVRPSGALYTQDCEPWDLKHSCSLDVAEQEDVRLVDIADALGVTHQNISLTLMDAMKSFSKAMAQRIDPAVDLGDEPAPTLGRKSHGGAP